MNAETPGRDNGHGSGRTRQRPSQTGSPLDDLLALVEVYHALPAEALRIVLDARGLGGRLDLERLDHPYLAALAVHTHTPAWREVRYLRRPARHKRPSPEPLMVDVPL